MTCWLLAPGVALAHLGDGWVAHSQTSGETHLLNEESVVVLEALDIVTPRTEIAIGDHLSAHLDIPSTELQDILRSSWISLVDAGLVREAA